MKAVIIYYSYSGNTKKIANILAKLLSDRFEVEQTELVSLDEAKSFFGQVRRALVHKYAKIQPVNFNLSRFDLVCFGTPVWAFAPAPAMNTYLAKCFWLGDKSIILFATYGSGTGLNRCLNYMQKILAKKGVKRFSRFSIQQFKVNDLDFVLSEIREKTRL